MFVQWLGLNRHMCRLNLPKGATSGLATTTKISIDRHLVGIWRPPNADRSKPSKTDIGTDLVGINQMRPKVSRVSVRCWSIPLQILLSSAQFG